MIAPAAAPPLPRDEITRRIVRLIEGASRGESAAIVARGGARAGKTHLAMRASAEALRRSFRVAEVDAQQSSRPAYATDRLTRHLGVRSEGATDDLARLHGLRLACQRAGAGRAGVAIIIDNAEYLADADAEALHDLLVSPPLASFFCFLTVGDTPAGRRIADDLSGGFGAAQMRAESVRLGPLTDDEVAAIAEERLAAGLMTYRFVRDLRALSAGVAGHVMSVLEAVEQLPPAERAFVMTGSEFIDEAIAPGSLVETMTAPLSALPDDAVRAARALAVLRAPSTVKAVASVADLPYPNATAALTDLEDRGMVTTQLTPSGEVLASFTIPLLGVAVRCATPLLLLRALNDRAAPVSEQAIHAEEDGALVEHYLGGSQPLLPARVERVVTTAQQFVARSRYAAARRVLEAAIARGAANADEPLPPRAFTVLSEALSRSGAANEASRVLDVAAAAEQPVGSAAEAMIRQARTAIALGREQIAISVIEAGLRRDDLDQSTRAMLSLELGRLLMTARDPERGRSLVNEAYEIAVAIPDHRLTADIDMTLHVRYLYDGQAQHALTHSRRALVSSRHAEVPARTRARAITSVGSSLLDAKTLDRGIHWLRRANRDAEVAEDLATVSWTSQVLGEICIEQGLWNEAAQWIARAVRLDSGLHRDQSLRRSLAIDARLRALRGVLDPQWADQATFPRTSDWAEGPPAAVSICIAHVEHSLLAGHAREAQALVRETIAQMRGPLGRGRSVVVDLLSAAIEIARVLGDREAAREATEDLAMAADALRGELPVVLAQLEVARAHGAALNDDWNVTSTAAIEAGDQLVRLGFRYRAAHAYALAGEAQIHLGQPQAEDYLTRAFRVYRTAGAQPRVTTTRALLHEIGSRVPRTRDTARILTGRQWEIARLASEGRTDAAIAAGLSISRRTVTTHMHHVLGRLDLTSRQQLAAWFREHPQT